MAGQIYRSLRLDAPAPVTPPAPAEPTRRRRSTGRRGPRWARICVMVGASLTILSGVAIIGGKVLLDTATASITQQNLLGDGGVRDGSAANISGAIDLLLIGLDQRPTNPDEGVRADTIVILHVPASHDQAYLVSLPRDTRVRIPAYRKSGYHGGTDKINAAFAFGYQGSGTEVERRARGVELLALTIRDATGIQFNGAAIIDFTGFEAVLKELGGVTMCIERRAESIHLAENATGDLVRVWYDDNAGKVRGVPAGYHPVVYQPGCNQRLDPMRALDYTRIRKGECCPMGDYDRQRHQQQLLKAIMAESTSRQILTDPVRLLRVTEAAGKAFILDTQGVPINDFIFTLKGITSNDLMLVKTNAGKTNTIPGTTDEQLTDDSKKMLTAVRDGKLLEFLAGHPDFVAPAT